MRTKSGDIIAQYDLHECEAMGLIKIDLLRTDAMSKIQECLELLLDKGKIEWQGSLRDTYEKYIGVYNLERYAEDMWRLLWEHKVISAFQMEKESGKQALALVKPHSVDDLATINSVIRLMPQEKGAETPLNKFARFHEDINEWYQEMEDYGLTEEEQNILKEIVGVSYGICEAQEYLILLTMHPAIGGFSLSWADSLRKAVAKKNPKAFDELEKQFFDNAVEKKLSKNLINYVWNVLIKTQRGYGLNL
jgi:DNA polymerase-3 subunit alpha